MRVDVGAWVDVRMCLCVDVCVCGCVWGWIYGGGYVCGWMSVG